MSEFLPLPEADSFPPLDRDSSWVREVPAGAHIARIFRSTGPHASRWYEFRSYGPLDGRFDPHPPPSGDTPGVGVMYGVLEGVGDRGAPSVLFASPFAAAILEVFQSQRMIRLEAGGPAFVDFALARPLRLLDLSDSDWVTAAGGNAAISSGDRSVSRAWARAIANRYPELDGLVSSSSILPSARVVALWAQAADALPEHPSSLIRLDRAELFGVIDAIADRYGYTVLSRRVSTVA